MKLYEGIYHDVEDERLIELLQLKSDDSRKSVKDVIWMYINRGIFEDNFGDDILFKLHSDEYIDKVDKALGLD